MNLTSSSLFLSNQLEYVVHLLLSSVLLLLPAPVKLLVFEKILNPLVPVYPAVKPAFFEILHLQDPSLQCFPLSHKRNASVTGGRTSLHQLFQIPLVIIGSGATNFPSRIRVIGHSSVEQQSPLRRDPTRFPQTPFSAHDHGRLRTSQARLCHHLRPYVGLTVH